MKENFDDLADELIEKYNDNGLFSFKKWADINNVSIGTFDSHEYRAFLEIKMENESRKITIGYSTSIRTNGTRRFAIAHEISHIILDKESINEILKSNEGRFVAYDTFLEFADELTRQKERKYNDLAARILMPREAFTRAIKVMDNYQLSDLFGVSLAAVDVRRKILNV